jgi:ElaB/YqjD/DUF883 family membrane-anchored ribosome-binding protein
MSADSYVAYTANPNVTRSYPVHPANNEVLNMQSTSDPVVDDLNRIVAQAEALLQQVGEETGAAAEAVRERVTQTLNQARARLATTAAEAEQLAETFADRADRYVRSNPWQSVALAALLGGALTLLIAKMVRNENRRAR